MGYYRLGLAVVATLSLLTVVKPEPASAGSALALAMMQAGADVATGARLADPRVNVAHVRRSQSFYCYPRNYWWFYRPYTTALDGHARCMPYFHYPDESYGRRGAQPNRYVK
jgi:hypothetical protein